MQACGKQKDIVQAKQLHGHIARHGLESNEFLCECLVEMYVKCGSLEDGLHVFYCLPRRTVFSWTVIISAQVQRGHARAALTSYNRMWQEGVRPNEFTFASVLKACGIAKDIDETKRIHADALRCGCTFDAFVGATLVDVYVKCGSSSEAWKVFNTLQERSLIAWNSMIAGYVHDNGEKALQLYAQMQQEKVQPDDRTLVYALKACGSLATVEVGVLSEEGRLLKVESLKKIRKLHADAVRMGYEFDDYICTTLVHLYSSCGDIGNAQSVFHRMSKSNVVVWTAMISGFVRQGHDKEALELYEKMQQKHMKPDARTFVSVLKACGRLAASPESFTSLHRMDWLHKAKRLHREAVMAGYESNVFLRSTLVHIYANCGLVSEARCAFDMMAARSVVLWNTMIAGYVKLEQGEQALQLYVQMQEMEVKPDDWTFASLLQACVILALVEKEVFISGEFYKVESLRKGQKLHADIFRSGYGSDLFVGNVLIHMYVSCGSIQDAQNVFATLPKHDVCSWNTMLAGYAEFEQWDKALQLYAQMQQEGVNPDEATFLAIIKACTIAGALESCIHIHSEVLRKGFVTNGPVSNALLHAYCRCGSMEHARSLFDSLPHRNVVAWTTLIAGFARLGQGEKSLSCFLEMQRSGTKANEVTFTSILSACSHTGMVSQGLQLFESMIRDHGVVATAGHFGIMVDILSRAGMFNRLQDLLSAMPAEPDYYMWMSLLGACRKHLNHKLGRRAFESAVALDPKQSAAYVVMANLYTHLEMWEDANEIDQMRASAAAWKKPGQSWIEHDQKLHRFAIAENLRNDVQEFLAMLRQNKLESS